MMPHGTLRAPYILTVDGHKYVLTQGERNILMALMALPLCTKLDMYEALWPNNCMQPLVRRFDTHLGRLRKLLAGHWLIKVRWGQGWYLEKYKRPDAGSGQVNLPRTNSNGE